MLKLVVLIETTQL